ncbi:MAG: zinc-ribbon domain-containing protein [Bacillota bacterium]|nr:zinc-ribbon domain-containing protein [Bacillota bacterium]
MTQHCPSCGSELAADAKFCNRCGQAVAATPQEKGPSPQAPSSDRRRSGGGRRFVRAGAPWTGVLVVSVVLSVSLVGFAAWLVFAGDGGEEATPAAPTGPAARAVGATPTPAVTPRLTPGATPSPRAQLSPTASPAATVEALVVSCEFPPDIKRLRFSMSLNADLPTTREPGAGEGALLRDMKMEVAIIIPDRTSMVMTVGGQDSVSLIQVGSRSWVKAAGLPDWMEGPSSEELGGVLSPLDFCESAEEPLSTALSQVQGKKEPVNGIKAVHYHLDKVGLAVLREALGGTEDLGELPEEFVMDVWLAEDGNWPVRMDLVGSDQDEQGQPLSLEMSIEFKDLNDSTITIEPPR